MQTLSFPNTGKVNNECLNEGNSTFRPEINVDAEIVGSESDRSEHSVKNGALSGMTNAVSQRLQVKTRSASNEKTPASVAFENGIKSNSATVLVGKKLPSPEKPGGQPTNSTKQFNTLRGSTTRNNSTVRVIPNAGSQGLDSNLNSKLKDEGIFKLPASVASSELQPKKMKMVTVPKIVPLINTVGNQSKFIALTFPLQSQSQVTSSIDPTSISSSIKNAQAEDVSQTASILKARLTSSSPGVSQPGTPLQISMRDVSKVCIENSSSPKLLSSVETSNKLDQVITRTISSSKENDMSDGIETLSLTNSKSCKKYKAVFTYEKGLTRLVAVEPRTVTMVDVSTQVFIPQSESQGQEVKDLIPQTSLQAVSSEHSGSIQPPATSGMSLSQKQFVVVDKNGGKKVIAIPRQILNNYSGPKSFVVEGKSVKRKFDGSPDCMSKGCSIRSAVDPLDITAIRKLIADSADVVASTVKSVLESEANHSKSVKTVLPDSENHTKTNTTGTLSDSHLGRKRGDVITVASPLSAGTVTTSSCQALSVKTSPVQSESDALLNCSPLQTVDRTQAIQLSSSVSRTPISLSSPDVQSFSNNSDTLILPLNSPIKTTSTSRSESSSLHPLPNTSSLFILVPNNSQESLGTDNCELNHESGEIPGVLAAVENFLSGQKRTNQIVNTGTPPFKKRCFEPIAQAGAVSLSKDLPKQSEYHARKAAVDSKGCQVVHNSNKLRQNNINGSNQESPSGTPGSPVWNSPDTIVNSNANGALNMSSREEVDKFVKSAFTEFRYCLNFNKDGKLPIHLAVENNDYAAVKRQCIVLKARKSHVNITNSKDETPLQLALYYGHTSIVDLLLEHGADSTVVDQDGNSPLHLAVINAEDALDALLSSRYVSEKFLNCLNDEGFSALHLAAQYDRVNAINLLIKHGAVVDLPDGKSGRTALFHAVERKNYAAQKALVANGADMKEPTFTGATPFLITRSDAIAQLASGQDTVGEEIDIDTLLKSSRRSRVSKVK